MEPSHKDESVEETLKVTTGVDRRTSIRADRCIPPPLGCGGPATEFTDECSKREFAISGMCQKCQDKFFGV